MEKALGGVGSGGSGGKREKMGDIVMLLTVLQKGSLAGVAK